MSIYRVRHDVQATVSDPETGSFVYLDRRAAYNSNDPLVKAYPWAFTTDAEVEASDGQPEPGRIYSAPVEPGDKEPKAKRAPVEQATANPGELRNTKQK